MKPVGLANTWISTGYAQKSPPSRSQNYDQGENQLAVRAASHYGRVERRSLTFGDRTMSRGEAFGLKICIKIIHLKPLAGHSVKPQRRSPKAKLKGACHFIPCSK